MQIPIWGLAGYSGSGKTTVMEKLIPLLKAKGLRLAVVKHDGHAFEIDHPGKDSYRFSAAGADMVLLTSCEKSVVMDHRPLPLETLLQSIHDVDMIAVEGYKQGSFTQIGIARKAHGKGFPHPVEHFAAVCTDETIPLSPVPVFGLNDMEGLADFIMANKEDFTHFNDEGRARMVNVGDKGETVRTATAAARVHVNQETFRLIQSGGVKKGDVLTVAQIAGIMGAKRTPDIIPMCHPIQLTGADLALHLDEGKQTVEIRATVSCKGKTGVEMEALTAAAVAALTVYDMCKAVQRDMTITDVRLVEKTGGIHGDYHREDEDHDENSGRTHHQ